MLLPLLAFAQTPTVKTGRKPLGMANEGGEKLWGLWMMGQSLCDGSESLPIVTSVDTGWGNWSFARGVRTWIGGSHSADPEGRDASQFELAPLKAAVNGGLGETMANGLADHLKSTLIEPSDVKNEAPHFLVAYAGQGGRMIDELSLVDQSTDARTPAVKKGGGGYYRTSLDDARRATQQAKAQGKTFAIAALVWMQGEANGGPTGGINPSRWDAELPRPKGQEWYRDRLIAYRKQWSRDLLEITGQKEIPLFTYQTLGPAGEGQVMAADADPNIYMVGPHYMVPSAVNGRREGNYGAAIHLSADGERWYGEQVAKVAHRVLEKGEAWQPLRPRKAVIDAARTSVLVTFMVPRPPLVLDESFLPLQQQVEASGGYSSLDGFQLRNEKGGTPTIKAVEVEPPNRLRIRLVSALPAGAGYSLTYGSPRAGQIGAISAVRSGPVMAKQSTTELLIPGDIRSKLKLLMDEGAFYVANTLGGEKYAQTVIRHVGEENGSTVLRFEERELRNHVPFAVGQALMVMRPFQYGNLHDSDPEPALYAFADPGYGRRAGQKYPLWNWSILYSGFPVSDK